jgi:hypothetical protein
MDAAFLVSRTGCPWGVLQDDGELTGYSIAVPGDIKAVASNGFGSHIQITPDMRGGTLYFLHDS